MGEALANDETRDFWTEVMKVHKSGSTKVNVMDGQQGNEAASAIFAEKYKKLYNSISYDEAEMNNLQNDIDRDIHEKCEQGKCDCNHTITTEHVYDSVKSLKPCKKDGNVGLSTDHLIHGGHALRVHRGMLFTCAIKHGYTPP